MRKHRPWLSWTLFGAFALFIGFVIRIANRGQDGRFWSALDSIPLGDKLGHLLLIGTLCLLLNLALQGRTLTLGGRRILLGTVLVVVFVIVEEGSQLFIVSRTFDLGDLLADGIGIAAASWLTHRLGKGRK